MIVTTTLLAALLTAAPASAKLDKDADGIVYSQHLAFRIPLNLSDQDRQRCKAIRLFVSQDQGETWVRHSDGSPDMRLVTFRAKQDGTFWFTLAVVTPDGVQEPADVRTVEPGLKVVVDSTPPNLTLKPVKNTSGKRGVRWEVNEEHLDPLSLRVAVWRQGATEWELEQVRHPENQLVWFDEEDQVQKIQAMICDRAGNQSIQQVDIYGDRFAKKTPSRFAIEDPDSQMRLASSAPVEEPPMTSMVQRVAHSSPISDDKSLDSLTPPPLASVPPGSKSIPPKALLPPSQPLAPVKPPVQDEPPMEPSLCRSDSLVVNYALDEGQSNAIVELWGTQDNGKTWAMLAVDTDGKSPVEAKLRSPGVWGLLVRVPKSANDSGIAPEPGTQPDTYVELDMESPQVTVEPVTMEGSNVVLHWRASDKNLGETPVTILHSETAAGPWEPIAEQLPNTGSYVWQPNKPDGTMHYFKIEVSDRAGNVGRGMTRTTLRTASKPRSRVLDIESTR